MRFGDDPFDVWYFCVPERDKEKAYAKEIILIIAGLKSKDICLPIVIFCCDRTIKPFLTASGDRIEGVENIKRFLLLHDRR